MSNNNRGGTSTKSPNIISHGKSTNSTPAPATVLKRFAGQLESSNNLETRRFRDINLKRANDFIKKPYTHEAYESLQTVSPIKKSTIPGIFDYTNPQRQKASDLPLDAPEFQNSLGPKSRFGEGDGSFWDKWVNADSIQGGRSFNGTQPLSCIHAEPTTGYKRFYKSKLVSDEWVAVIKPYAERRKERIARDNMEDLSDAQKAKLESLVPTGTKMQDLPWDSIVVPNAQYSPTQQGNPDLKLPPLSPSEKELYFGEKAKAVFFDFYKQLSRNRHVLDENVNELMGEFPDTYTAGNSTDQGEAIIDSKASLSVDVDSELNSSNSEMFEMKLKLLEKVVQFNEKELLQDTHTTVTHNKQRKKSQRLHANSVNQNSKEQKHANSQLHHDTENIASALLVAGGGSGGEIPKKSSRQLIPKVDSDQVMREQGRHLLVEAEQAMQEVHLKIDPTRPVGKFRPMSARTKFLLGCVNEEIVPKSSLLIRKNMTSVLDLSRQNIGENVTQLVAKSLLTLPYLSTLNLSENKLSDDGMVSIISTISKCEHLTSLNISGNRMGTVGVNALTSFLGSTSTQCALKELIIRNAKVDDDVVVKILTALMQSGSSKLSHLDLGANVIGKEENVVALRPDRMTAGKAIASYLTSPNCSLVTLILDWNMIRFDSAIVLASSLKHNKSLTVLDLSYNGFGCNGGELLGDALHFNHNLKQINLAHNNITPRACFTIATGIRCSPTVEFVNLSNNPIGEYGARALMMLNSRRDQINVNIRECSLKSKDPSCWFDILKPQGVYNLDLSKPYERAIFLELIFLLGELEDVKIKHCRIIADPLNEPRNSQDLNLVIRSEKKIVQSDESGNTNAADTIRSIAADIFTARKLFRQFDVDSSGYLDRDELSELLKHFGLTNTKQTVNQLLALYDLDGSGVIEEAEFVGFLEEVQKSAENTQKREEEVRVVVVNGSTTPYKPPDIGKIDLELILDKSLPDFMRSISRGSVDKVIKASKNASDSSTIIDYALANMKLNAEDALSFYRIMLKEAGDKVKVLIRLLPHMTTPADARQLLAVTTFNDVKEKLILKEALEPLYRPIVGMVNGYYNLDLSEKLDEQCFNKLLEVNEITSEERRRQLGDVSQLGNWSCFRNVIVDGKAFTSKDNIANIFPPSKLHFDFSTLHSPGINVAAISDVRFVNVIAGLGMMEDAGKSTILARISAIDCEARQASHGLGVREWTMGIKVAESAAKHLHLCYENLHLRPSLEDIEKILKDSASLIDQQQNLLPVSEPDKATPRSGRRRDDSISLDPLDALESTYTMANFNLYFRSKVNSLPLSVYLRSKRTVDALLDTLGGRPLSCAQLAIIVERLSGGFIIKNPWSTVRVDMIISLFSQLIDPVNFEVVLKLLTAIEIGMVNCRLGWLMIWNPLKPEGYAFLDLKQREERQVLRMMILLSVIEPGENWLDKGYMTNWNAEPAPNWAMPLTWYSEAGIPEYGILKLRYYSGEGSGFSQCQPNVTTRLALMALVFSQPYSQDVRFTHKPTLERAEAVMSEAGLTLSFIHANQKVIGSRKGISKGDKRSR